MMPLSGSVQTSAIFGKTHEPRTWPEHADGLASAKPTSVVRLLPGFDQYVLGPGTDDSHVIPAARRTAVSKQSGWIAPIVVAGGVVSGTWDVAGDTVRIAWFSEAGRPPKRALGAEVERWSSIHDRPLSMSINPS